MKLRLPVVVFVAFGLTGLAGALAMAAALSFNLDRGFEEYLALRDDENLQSTVRMMQRRARVEELDVQQVTIIDLVPRSLVELDKRRQRWRDADDSPPQRRFRGPPPDNIERRLFVLDVEGAHVLGPSNYDLVAMRRPLATKEVYIEGRKVGTVGLVPRGRLPDGLTARFLTNQYRTGGALIVSLLFLNLIPAWFIARAVDNLVGNVKAVTGDIVNGSYQKRAPDSAIKEIADLTGDINMLTEELQRLAGLRRKWLAETSHELRTPLAAMTAEVEALADGVRPYSPDTILSLREEAGHLGRLVNDLHFLAVSDLSAPAYSFKNLDPAALCKGVIDRFASQIDNAGLTFRFELQAEEPISVTWDKGRIEQALSNILVNSMRYTDAPGTILLSMHDTENEVVLTFEDSAPGVSPEDMKQLFEPLFRADATRSRATGGSGLGLSVTRTIVQMHRGSITADASALGGLRLRVTLPKKPGRS